jgi:hypothetical protein
VLREKRNGGNAPANFVGWVSGSEFPDGQPCPGLSVDQFPRVTIGVMQAVVVIVQVDVMTIKLLYQQDR